MDTMVKIFFSDEIQWLEIVITILLIPSSIYSIRYIINRFKYKKILGTYTGLGGKSIVTIKYPFFSFGFINISCTEAGGECWEGKYKMDKEGYSLQGKYVWNKGRNKTKPDTGRHELHISDDAGKIDVKWERLTGQPKSGATYWEKKDI